MNNTIGHNLLTHNFNNKVSDNGGFSSKLLKDGSISLVRLYKEKQSWEVGIEIQAPNENGFKFSERLRIGSVKKINAFEAARIANCDTFAGAKFNVK